MGHKRFLFEFESLLVWREVSLDVFDEFSEGRRSSGDIVDDVVSCVYVMCLVLVNQMIVLLIFWH